MTSNNYTGPGLPSAAGDNNHHHSVLVVPNLQVNINRPDGPAPVAPPPTFQALPAPPAPPAPPPPQPPQPLRRPSAYMHGALGALSLLDSDDESVETSSPRPRLSSPAPATDATPGRRPARPGPKQRKRLQSQRQRQPEQHTPQQPVRDETRGRPESDWRQSDPRESDRGDSYLVDIRAVDRSRLDPSRQTKLAALSTAASQLRQQQPLRTPSTPTPPSAPTPCPTRPASNHNRPRPMSPVRPISPPSNRPVLPRAMSRPQQPANINTSRPPPPVALNPTPNLPLYTPRLPPPHRAAAAISPATIAAHVSALLDEDDYRGVVALAGRVMSRVLLLAQPGGDSRRRDGYGGDGYGRSGSGVALLRAWNGAMGAAAGEVTNGKNRFFLEMVVQRPDL